MLKKKKLHHSSQSKLNQQQKSLPLSRLEQIVRLQNEIVNILGPKHIEIDEDADLFTRLEELYLRYMQSQPLGLQVLEKILALIRQSDAPVKIKMTYLLAHQNYLQGQNPIPILQEGFQNNLLLKQKTAVGYRCGLVLVELSMCPRLVQNILSSLVVSLEEEVGFQPVGLRQLSRNSTHEIKSVYLGRKMSHKSKSKLNMDCKKLLRIDLSKCLYEAYMVGCQRLQSQAKRRYYRDCLQELGRRLIRQNPGINLRQKLKAINQGDTAARQFERQVIPLPTSILHPKKNTFSKTDPQNFWKEEIRQSHSKVVSELPTTAVNEFQRPSKSQFQQNGTASCNFSPLHYASKENSLSQSEHRYNKFKIELKPNKLHSRPNTSKSSSHHKPSSSLRSQKQKENVVQSRQKESPIILKFNRLQLKSQGGKPEIRKRRLKPENPHWQEKGTNVLENVFNLNYMPNIKEEASQEIAIQTEQEELKQKQSRKHLDSNRVIESFPLINDEAPELCIDKILGEGLEWIEQTISKQTPEEQKEQVVLPETIESKEEKIQQQSRHFFMEAPKIEEIGPTLNTEFNHEDDQIQQRLQPPQDKFSLKQSLKVIVNRLQIPQSLSSSVIDSNRSIPQEHSLMETSHMYQDLQNQPYQDYSDRHVEYKIVINNFTDGSRKIIEDGLKANFFDEKPKQQQICLKNKQSQRDKRESILKDNVESYLKKLEEELINSQIQQDQKNNSIRVKFNEDILNEAIAEIEKDQADYQNFSEKLQLKKVETIKITDGTNSFSIEEGVLNQEKSENSPQKAKEIISLSKTQVSSIISELVELYFQQIVASLPIKMIPNIAVSNSNIGSNLSNRQNSHRSHLSNPNTSVSSSGIRPFPRSSICDRLFEDEEMEKKFDPIRQQCAQSSLDDSDLSSEIHSSHDDQSTPFSPNSLSAEGRKQRNSLFTCSRFAGSKIEYEKQNSANCYSNMNIIEQLIKCIENKAEKIQLRQINEENNSLKQIRSRPPSERSSKSAKTSKMIKSSRDHSHVSVALEEEKSTSENQHSIKFDHWLTPHLKITPSEVSFNIRSSSDSHKLAWKSQEMPELLKPYLQKIKEVQFQILVFLDKFPKEQTSWSRILEEFNKIQLLPDNVQLFTVQLLRQGYDQPVKVTFEYHHKQKQIISKSSDLHLKIHPICVDLHGHCENILSKLTPDKIQIKENNLIFCDLWTILGKRNIKLRDKYENTTIHCVFEVFECFLQTENSFFYEIKDANGESMSFGNISYELRKKVIANIDMIIGFAIKLANKKIYFGHENIHQLLKLL